MARTGATILALGLGAGLACARYSPEPIEPGTMVEQYSLRTLVDPAVVAWIDSLNPQEQSVPRPWRPSDLVLAALYHRVAPHRWERQLEAARAEEVAAGAHPQPGLESDLELDVSGQDGTDPWGLAVRAVVPVELGGKRGARVAKARAGRLVVWSEIVEQRWALATDVRQAALRLAAAAQRLEDTAKEREVLDSVVALLTVRRQQGTTGELPLAQGRAERNTALVGEQEARREESDARVDLATAVGVPVAAIDGIRLASVDPADHCALSSAPPDSLRGLAVRRRAEVRRALAAYAVAEADLRLAVAASWPDLNLGPGLFFDHGVGKWLTGLVIPTIALNRNRGPIASAEAQRRVAAERLREAEEGVLAEVDGALARCEASSIPLPALREASQQLGQRAATMAGAFQRGEISRLELALARLEEVRSARAIHRAGYELLEANLAVEVALGVWQEDPPASWPPLGLSEKGEP